LSNGIKEELEEEDEVEESEDYRIRGAILYCSNSPIPIFLYLL